ncbi:ATP-binding protein [Nocardiopsis sp. YSL2]|uniref:ATP-binding protein n=1 Tax=Nocardiopsis sp. YSL2 TaxID=2939492 RepID=UPI0026F45588|nr:ATP-binding protein [Nocardiopsis sp. YSL2]
MTYAHTEEARPVVFWEHRTYPGHLSELRRVRADLATDLAGFDADLVDTLQLVTSELFANGVKYTRADPPFKEVIRALSMPDPATLRVSLSDCGGGGGAPRIPNERTDLEWDWAECQRGLVLVENLSTAWGHFRLAPWADLGTHVWAEFTVDPASTPPDLYPYVFAH